MGSPGTGPGLPAVNNFFFLYVENSVSLSGGGASDQSRLSLSKDSTEQKLQNPTQVPTAITGSACQ